MLVSGVVNAPAGGGAVQVVNADDFAGGTYVAHLRVLSSSSSVNVHIGAASMGPTGGLILRGGDAPFTVQVTGESLYAATDEPGGADLTLLAYSA